MQFKAKLNLKFYIVTFLLLCIVVLGWYMIYFINSNRISIDENDLIQGQTKIFLTLVLSIIVLSWTVSLITLIRQIVFGYGFLIDKDGIHTTATAILILAFIFVIPIKNIPYNAIRKIECSDGITTVYINKSKVEMLPFFRIFARKKYHLFSGYSVENKKEIYYFIYNFAKEHGISIDEFNELPELDALIEPKTNEKKKGCFGKILIIFASIVAFLIFDTLVLSVIFVESEKPYLVASDYSKIIYSDDVYIRIDELPENVRTTKLLGAEIWEDCRIDGLSKWEQSMKEDKVKLYEDDEGREYLWLVENYSDTILDDDGEYKEYEDFEEHYVYVCEKPN